MGPSREQIAEMAHQIWIEKGRPPGDGTEDWLEAERKLREDGSAGRAARTQKAGARKTAARKPRAPKPAAGEPAPRRRARAAAAGTSAG